jgi:RNA polymerase sigma factor (sigma-70 family)
MTTPIDDLVNDRLDCNKLEPQQADFKYLKTLCTASSWENARRDILKQIAHWHCRRTVLYYKEWKLKDNFRVGICEFHNAAMVKLGEALCKEWQALGRCATSNEVKVLARKCINRSHFNAHHALKRKDPGLPTRLPEDIAEQEENVPDMWSWEDEDMVDCLRKLEPVDKVILRQVRQGTTIQEIAKIVHLSAGQVSRRKANAIAQMRQCLGIENREERH